METIKELRERKGWTQLQLANEVGVTPSTIYNWERGRFVPRVGQLRDLAKALGVRMDEINLLEEDAETKKLVA